jgi:hypothetical protein
MRSESSLIEKDENIDFESKNRVLVSQFTSVGSQTEVFSETYEGELIERYVTVKNPDGSEIFTTVSSTDEVIRIEEFDPRVKDKKSIRYY